MGDEKLALRAKWIAAARELWSNTPEERHAGMGNNIAWSLYELRAEIGAEDKAFALEVAKVAAKAAPEDASVIDTLACTLHMNGQVEEAVKTVKRCLELEPDNAEWQRRLEEFGG
jgi:Flp pilus assembly protein TadD